MNPENATLLNRGRYANADVWRVETEAGPVVRKDFRPRSWLIRLTIGRFFTWREVHFLQRLTDAEGVPQNVRRINAFCCEERYYPSRVLRTCVPPPPLTFFQKLEAMVKEFHRRGVAHLDLRNARNILVTNDNEPMVLDWQSAIPLTGLFRIIRPIAIRVDLAGVYKHWQQSYPGTFTHEQQQVVDWLKKYRRLWIPRGYFFSRKP